MFEIVDEMNNPLIEIRRNPASGEADFNGLLPQSTHIRLPNWMLYQGNPVEFLREFLVRNDYIFKRIYRIDIAYDFEFFDSGDQPARFAKRYLQGVFRKINQCFLSAHGNDRWNDCQWQSLSWGSRTSMVSTKLYNKTLELAEGKADKPWIKTAWMIAGLIDNPMSMTKRDIKGNLYKPEIWRVEFSMKSAADGWITLEWQNGKKQRKQTIPHRLEMFDAKDKLWARFQDLAFHYFRFKYREYVDIAQRTKGGVLESLGSEANKPLKRKDRCRDKVLFYWDAHHEFTQLASAPVASKRARTDDILLRRLKEYRLNHPQKDIREACDCIIHNIERLDKFRFIPLGDNKEITALRIALQRKIGGDQASVLSIIEEVKQLLEHEEIF